MRVPRFTLKRKGRYLLMALGAWALYSWWPGAGSSDILHNAAARMPSPDCLQSSEFQPAPTPPSALTGRLGLWVARIDPITLQPIRVVAQDPDGLYPLASSYKQAVLWALLHGVDAGEIALNEKFSVTHANQSLGRYPYDHSNVVTLAQRMIHNSDNTATDILHRRVGFGAVQAVADELHLCRTRLLLPTKHWWIAQAGLDPAWPGATVFANATAENRMKFAQALDAASQAVRADVLQVNLDRYFENRYDPQADLGTHNVSTPFEFGTLIARQFLASGLSPSSSAMLREVMASGYGRTQLHSPMVYWGGKGGNGWKILTMTGYFQTPNGEHVVYVFMQHGSHEDYTLPNSRTAFRWINDAVQQALSSSGQVAARSP
ncbi:serine hydrolase [Deinococcus peraridilitoris]|uniref:Beta-lactamase class A catalytic domain-containing protein n=1 Tax=Deinococcus peraridilitoris (strain DSM 19664 / LMG 22246 / CIP 109416 / KR-200) TaxID=937777 RepID=L0A6A8_DEIPD|nr:serine hydrolase [Deinococcus peraridilitoris]AFZ68984.1 hypothetical protein Deipe_3554 [Deinococcus peraridilitoris DSM 19664]